jgi:hypothetical protein
VLKVRVDVEDNSGSNDPINREENKSSNTKLNEAEEKFAPATLQSKSAKHKKLLKNRHYLRDRPSPPVTNTSKQEYD